MIVKIALLCLFFQRTTIQTYSYKNKYPKMFFLSFNSENNETTYLPLEITDNNFYLSQVLDEDYSSKDPFEKITKTFNVHFKTDKPGWLVNKQSYNDENTIMADDFAVYVDDPQSPIVIYQIKLREKVSDGALFDYMSIINMSSDKKDLKGYENLMNNPPQNVENFENEKIPTIGLAGYQWEIELKDLIILFKNHGDFYNGAIKKINEMDTNDNFKGLEIPDGSQLKGIEEITNPEERKQVIGALINDIIETIYLRNDWNQPITRKIEETIDCKSAMKKIAEEFKEDVIAKSDEIFEAALKQKLSLKSNIKNVLDEEVVNSNETWIFKEIDYIHKKNFISEIFFSEYDQDINASFLMIKLVSNLFKHFQLPNNIDISLTQQIFPLESIVNKFKEVKGKKKVTKLLLSNFVSDLYSKLVHCFSGIWLELYIFMNQVPRVREFFVEYLKLILEKSSNFFDENLIDWQDIIDVRAIFYYEETKQSSLNTGFEIFNKSDRLNRLLLI